MKGVKGQNFDFLIWFSTSEGLSKTIYSTALKNIHRLFVCKLASSTYIINKYIIIDRWFVKAYVAIIEQAIFSRNWPVQCVSINKEYQWYSFQILGLRWVLVSIFERVSQRQLFEKLRIIYLRCGRWIIDINV